MIPFDFPLFFRTLARFKPGCPGRGFGMLLRLLGLALLELGNTCCLLLDELFFPGYRRVKIEAPVFIIGNPRSGTTFLHRILSRDHERFSAFKTWEILFPSVLQKKAGYLIGRIDGALGHPLRRLIVRIERRVLGRFHELHPTGLFEAEEDEMLFLHAFASLYLVFLFPLPELYLRFADFDAQVPAARRVRLMKFYRACLQRQAYARGRERVFLAKNPFFSGKVGTLHGAFPDARFIYLVRNPLQAIPSTISEGHASCVYAERNQPPSTEFQELVYGAAKIFYQRPLAYADRHPDCRFTTLRFPDLVKQPEQVVTGLYEKLGFPMSEEFRAVLRQEQSEAGAYRSSHHYALEHFILPAERITTELADIFTRFNFQAEADGGGRHVP